MVSVNSRNINYHTHSRYCDGKGELREYVEFALEHGFTHLGFSGHAPVPFKNNFAIKAEEYIDYCNEVRALKAEYSDRIDIRLGLEIDYIPDRYFTYSEPWFRNLVFETVDLIREYGVICEINTRGLYKARHNDFYPARDTIRHMSSLAIPVIVSTDAHTPSDLNRFEGAYEFLQEIGYREIETCI